MEAITNNENTPALRAYSKGGSHAPQASAQPSESAATKVRLTDVNSLASRASEAGEDIRPDAVEEEERFLPTLIGQMTRCSRVLHRGY